MYKLYAVQEKAMEQVMPANAEGWAAVVERTGRGRRSRIWR